MKYIFRCFPSLEIEFHALLNQGRVVFVSLRWGRFANFDTELQYNKKKISLRKKSWLFDQVLVLVRVIFWSTK